MLLLLAGALLLPGTASAQRGPCAEDAKKFCADVMQGGARGAIGKCLQEHEADLSSACRDRINKGSEAVAQFKEACGEDVQKLCASAQRGGGGVLKCMDENFDSLSLACQGSVTTMKEKRQGRGARTQ